MGERSKGEVFIVKEGGLCMFQVLLGDPRIFFSGVTFPSDQEHAGGWRAVVA